MHRMTWDDVPAHVRAELHGLLGAEVVRVHEVHGGYSPCLAGPADLSDGRRVFLKAVDGSLNPDSPIFVRRELEHAAALPAEVPAPRLLDTFDDGEWVAGIFECIEGGLPVLPWDRVELDRVLAALEALGEVPAPAGWRPGADAMVDIFDGWQMIASGHAARDDWWTDHLGELVELERAACDAVNGDRLVHGDIRSDNVVIEAATGRVLFVDWAHPSAGAPWVDLLFWLPTLSLEGGGAPAEVVDRVPLLRGVDESVVTAVAAGLAGYFVSRGAMPPLEGLPTLRAFQHAQSIPALAWLRDRLGA